MGTVVGTSTILMDCNLYGVEYYGMQAMSGKGPFPSP